MSPFLVVVAICFAGRTGAPRQGPTGRSSPSDSPGLARALESQDDAQQPPEGRRAMATSPPRGRQEEWNKQSCEGPQRDPRRAVSGCAEQGRLLGLSRFLRRAPAAAPHITSSTLRADGPGLGRTAARYRRPVKAGTPSSHGERGGAALAERVAAGALLDDLRLAASAGLDLHRALGDRARALVRRARGRMTLPRNSGRLCVHPLGGRSFLADHL